MAALVIGGSAALITTPFYNEESQIRGLVESLLAIDYPADRRQVLIVSDGSAPRWLTVPAFLVLGHVAALHALMRAVGDRGSSGTAGFPEEGGGP